LSFAQTLGVDQDGIDEIFRLANTYE
jgi:hypothetical protein